MKRSSGNYRDDRKLHAVEDPPAKESVTLEAGPSGSEVMAVAGAAARPSTPERPRPFERSIWRQMTLPEDGGAETMGELLDLLEHNKEFRSAAVLEVVRRCRLALDRCSPDAKPDATVSVRISDVLVVAQALTGRLR